MPSAVITRVDPRELSVNITASSGKVFRWGPDEKDASRVPSAMSIATQMPGGFGTMTCNLARRADLSWYDIDRFAPCTVTGHGLVAFDGYLSSAPFNRDTQYLVTPNAIGWSGHMKDDASFTMIYIDRQLSKWQPPTVQRQLNMVSAGDDVTNFTASSAPDPGGKPSVLMEGSGPWPATPTPTCEAWYDAGANNLIARLQFSGIGLENFSITDANKTLIAYTSIDDVATSVSSSGNITSVGAAGYNLTPNRYGLLQFRYVAAGGTSGTTYGFGWENMAVIGNHGLTIQKGPSNQSPGADDGFYGGDIAAHIIQNAAPLLTATRGVGGIVQDTFVVPDLAFNSPVDADTAIQQLNQYYLYDYGVYENKAFFWQPPGSGRQWRVRLGEGVQLQDQGPQIETAFNGVVVQFTDVAGITRYVGPPGYGGDGTSTNLQDTSSTNPCNAYGRKRWALVQIGTSTVGAAIAVGEVFLATSLSRPSTGTLTVAGFARDSSGRDWPAWMIRAGDTIEIVDQANPTPRYVLSTQYSHDQLQNILSLDAPPNSLDWLTARLGLAISALG